MNFILFGFYFSFQLVSSVHCRDVKTGQPSPILTLFKRVGSRWPGRVKWGWTFGPNPRAGGLARQLFPICLICGPKMITTQKILQYITANKLPSEHKKW